MYAGKRTRVSDVATSAASVEATALTIPEILMLQNIYNVLQSGAPEQAETMSREWLQSRRRRSRLLLLALSLDAQTRSLEALSIFERLTALHPNTPAHWTNPRNVRRTLANVGPARPRSLRAAIELGDDNGDARLNLGMLARDAGEFERCTRTLAAGPCRHTRRCDCAHPGGKCLLTSAATHCRRKACSPVGRAGAVAIPLCWPRLGGSSPVSAKPKRHDKRSTRPSDCIRDIRAYAVRQAAYYERVNRLDEARAVLSRINERAVEARA
jgi:hypothetical protein